MKVVGSCRLVLLVGLRGADRLVVGLRVADRAMSLAWSRLVVDRHRGRMAVPSRAQGPG